MVKRRQPLVSVIINCHNGEAYLREAIDSVYAQTYENWEIVFWDNASTDSSDKIARSYDFRLRYFKGKQLVPLYTARNLALDECHGSLVTFLDCDDIWLPHKLESQVHRLLSGARIVYGGYEIIDSHGSKTGHVVDEGGSGWITGELLRKNPISIGCVMIDAGLMKEYRFDPTYNLLGDFELWIRLSLSHKFDRIKGIVEQSRQHGNNTSHNLKDDWLHERRRFYRKFLRSTSPLRHPEIIRYIIKTELKGVFCAS